MYYFFWSSLFVLMYAYIGYPLLISVWSKMKPWPVLKKSFFCRVSLVLIVQNEEAHIKDRMENLLSLVYPSDSFEIIVVSDGSRDGTTTVLQSFQAQNVKVMANEQQQGKAMCLNQALGVCSGKIVVFTDARQRFESTALKELVANFSDPCVGAVSGELLFEDGGGTTIREGINFYWNYEKLLRKSESAVHSTLGATGAIYAIRRELFQPIPADTLIDDVLIPAHIVLQGFRCVFDGNAIAYDQISTAQQQETRRKIRTIAGNFQLFWRQRALLNPFRNSIWLQTVSHKFIRIIAPFFLGLFLLSNSMLLEKSFFKVMFVFQCLFYLCGLIGFFLRKKKISFKLFSAPYMFLILNICVLRAFMRYLFFDPQSLWQRSVSE